MQQKIILEQITKNDDIKYKRKIIIKIMSSNITKQKIRMKTSKRKNGNIIRQKI